MEPTHKALQSRSDERNILHYQVEIARFPPLCAAAVKVLVLSLPKPEAATNLIEGHLSYVVQIARQYQDQGVPLMDLVGEGNICLVETVQTFHRKQTASFHHSLKRALHRTMKQALCANDPQGAFIPLDELAQGFTLLPSSLPLACRNPEDTLIAQEASNAIFDLLERLPYRQRQTLTHYYGFTGQIHGSFVALSREWGISSGAVYVAADEGMRKLRRARKELSEFLGDALYLFS